jgi:hypothetical protein
MMKTKVVFGFALALGMSGLVFGQANVAGKWTGAMAGRGGEQPVTLELTVAGTTVTGKLTQGAEGTPVDITNAKLEGNKLSFNAAGGGGRGGGFLYEATITGAEMSVTRTAAVPAGGAPAGAPPAGGAAPAAGGAPGGGGGGRPVTFTLKKA